MRTQTRNELAEESRAGNAVVSTLCATYMDVLYI